MAREKMFNPAFQKGFTEAINKENKIRSLNHLEDVAGFPRTARVDFGADFDSDDSDIEVGNEQFQKVLGELSDSCGTDQHDKKRREKSRQNQHTHISPKKTAAKKEPSAKKKKKEKKEDDRYIFPICNYCDFGWKYSTRDYITCPHHGQFHRGRQGYKESLRAYLTDQIRRESLSEVKDKKNESKLVNNFFL